MKWLRKLLGPFNHTASVDEMQFAYEFGNFVRAVHTEMEVVEMGPGWFDLKDQNNPKRVFRVTITKF